jgi:predicted nucleic acid-binding protein
VGRDIILDTGALIDVERGGKTVIALAKQAHKLGGDTVIPASALAQAWRGGPRSAPLAKVIDGSEIDALSEERAKEIGVRLGARGGSDITDAHVVCCAIERRATVATSDRDDIEALTDPDAPVRLIPV